MNDTGLDRLIQIFTDHDVQIPCPGEQSCILKYLKELKEWRTNPFKKTKECCEACESCDDCDWHCIPMYLDGIPEDWKV